jgi:hypothetical protein
LRRPKERGSGAIDDAIAFILDDSDNDDEFTDEYERWRKLELRWTKDQFKSLNADSNPIKYWLRLQPKYPTLSCLAIDILAYLRAAVSVSACSASLEIYSLHDDVRLDRN